MNFFWGKIEVVDLPPPRPPPLKKNKNFFQLTSSLGEGGVSVDDDLKVGRHGRGFCGLDDNSWSLLHRRFLLPPGFYLSYGVWRIYCLNDGAEIITDDITNKNWLSY